VPSLDSSARVLPLILFLIPNPYLYLDHTYEMACTLPICSAQTTLPIYTRHHNKGCKYKCSIKAFWYSPLYTCTIQAEFFFVYVGFFWHIEVSLHESRGEHERPAHHADSSAREPHFTERCAFTGFVCAPPSWRVCVCVQMCMNACACACVCACMW